MPKIKKNIKKTLKSTGELSDSFSEVKLTNQIDVLQSSPLTGGGNSRWTGRFATRLKTTPRDAFGFSVGETPLGTTLLTLTKDQLLTSKLALQFGMFYTRPGVGVSFDLLDNLTLSAAVYDLNNLYSSYAARFRFWDRISLSYSAEKDMSGQGFSFMGLGYLF